MKKEYDVIVVGGGPAGIGASIAAARNGASVLLIEKSNCLGGLATNALVSVIRTAGDNGGIVHEMLQRVENDRAGEILDDTTFLNLHALRVILLDMVEEAGVDLLLHTHLAGVVCDGDRITGVQYVNKDGLTTANARVVVDATGDGDVAVWAGATYDKGRKEDGQMQMVSLNFVLAGIDEDLLPPKEEFQAICREALSSGRLTLAGSPTLAPGKHIPPTYPPGVRFFQYDVASGVDGSDAASLTRGESVCHHRVYEIWQYLRTTFKAYEKSTIVDIASHLGIRETRRIHGEKTLTEEMVLAGTKHPDAVTRCSWYMDLHDGQNKWPYPEYRAARRPAEGDWFEIPYGCMIPLRIDGLFVAGRSLSSTRPANGAARLQPTCMNMGQAAGTAAALYCAKQGLQPREVDPVALRKTLVDQGMEL